MSAEAIIDQDRRERDRALFWMGWITWLCFLGRMLAVPRSLNIAEAIVYVALAIVIASYWGFSAWLRVQEKMRPEPADDGVRKDVTEMKARLNALLIKAGFQGL